MRPRLIEGARSNDGRKMVGCDKCDDWFHLQCIGVSDERANAESSFVCWRCRCASRVCAVGGALTVGLGSRRQNVVLETRRSTNCKAARCEHAARPHSRFCSDGASMPTTSTPTYDRRPCAACGLRYATAQLRRRRKNAVATLARVVDEKNHQVGERRAAAAVCSMSRIVQMRQQQQARAQAREKAAAAALEVPLAVCRSRRSRRIERTARAGRRRRQREHYNSRRRRRAVAR